jgi:hypothetical protein
MKGTKKGNLRNRTVKESLLEFFLAMLGSTFRLAPGYHSGSPTPFDTDDITLTWLLFCQFLFYFA